MTEYKIIKFCSECIDDVVNGEIEFTDLSVISEVSVEDCDNQNVDRWDADVWNNPDRVVNLD